MGFTNSQAPSLRSGRYSPEAFGFLNHVNPSVSGSNHYVFYVNFLAELKAFRAELIQNSYCTLQVGCQNEMDSVYLRLISFEETIKRGSQGRPQVYFALVLKHLTTYQQNAIISPRFSGTLPEREVILKEERKRPHCNPSRSC